MINHKVVMFAGSMGGHFVELMCLHTLFSKYESVLVTDNLKADKSDKRIASFKSIAYSTAWAQRRENTAGVKNTRSRWQNAFTYFSNGILKNDKRYNPTKIISVTKIYIIL